MLVIRNNPNTNTEMSSSKALYFTIISAINSGVSCYFIDDTFNIRVHSPCACIIDPLVLRLLNSSLMLFFDCRYFIARQFIAKIFLPKT